jgi:hypothetical protein
MTAFAPKTYQQQVLDSADSPLLGIHEGRAVYLL